MVMDTRAVRDISAVLMQALSRHREVYRREPQRLHVGPALMDMWRAELLSTGKLRPGGKFSVFDGVPVIVNPNVEVCEIE